MNIMAALEIDLLIEDIDRYRNQEHKDGYLEYRVDFTNM